MRGRHLHRISVAPMSKRKDTYIMAHHMSIAAATTFPPFTHTGVVQKFVIVYDNGILACVGGFCRLTPLGLGVRR